MTLWTPVLEELYDALEAERLLRPLRQALWLRPPYSERADADLLKRFREAPRLAPALALARQGNIAALRQAIRASFPQALGPELLHHLSLVWLRGAIATPENDSHALRERRLDGLEGLLYLIEFYREWMLHAVLRSVDVENARRALDALPSRLLSPELDAIRAVCGADEDEVQVRRACATLSAVEARIAAWTQPSTEQRPGGVAHASAPRATAQALQLAFQQAKEVALEQTLQRLDRDCAGAELLAADSAKLSTLFEAALHFAQLLGHAEELSATVLERAVELSWPLYHNKQHKAVQRLLSPLQCFADDLEQRFSAAEALGRQGLFSDFWVMWAQTLPLPRLDAPEAEQLLEQQQRRLRRALQLNPIHRNSKVVLAASNLNLCRRRLAAARSSVVKARALAELEPIEALLDEAEQLRPELSAIPELRAELNLLRMRYSYTSTHHQWDSKGQCPLAGSGTAPHKRIQFSQQDSHFAPTPQDST
ncbi:MAG: hypothetical protein RBU37_14295 [Myxococcota bacterium]|nr:hypothetical protein [Myxococcota bacterium]